VKAVNIEWDVDCEEDKVLLPIEMELPDGMEDEEEISDYLSEVIGFCHKGFCLLETNAHSCICSEKPHLKDAVSAAERQRNTLSHGQGDTDVRSDYFQR